MSWLKLATISLIVGTVMRVMLSARAESSWLLAALSAAAVHWVSGAVIIGLATVLRPSLPSGVTVIALWKGYWRTALFLTAINVPWNVYPVMLQRYTRSRLARMSHRLQGSAERR